MDATAAISLLQRGQKASWPSDAASLEFAALLDNHTDIPQTFRKDFLVPTKSQLKRKTLHDDAQTSAPASSVEDEAIYFCGNSLGLQPKAIAEYMAAYLKTWSSIAVGGHFTNLRDSPLVAYQDMAADCARKMVPIVGARDAREVVAMNTLTVNLHLMMAAFYQPDKPARKTKIMCEWRPFPSDWYAIESQIEWHGLDPKEEMLLVRPDGEDKGEYDVSTEQICDRITRHRDELALILLPGIQYYSGQLLDIPTITAHAHKFDIVIGWDLAHAAGNVELSLHDWGVDFACWCTYKYMNAGAGAIAGVFVHEKRGDSKQNVALKGWYGHDQSSRFLMDNQFVPTPGAAGFQLSNPSVVDLTCLSAALSVFEQTSMKDLRRRALLLTAYAEELLAGISERYATAEDGEEAPFKIITPSDPRQRGTQLSVLFKEELMEEISAALEENGVICDKRKPGIMRVAPVPLYNTFGDVARFMQIVEAALKNKNKASEESE
ncbi:Kynureninase [Cercospora zeina]